MYGDLGWGIYPQAHLVATDIDDRDDNVLANNDAFITLPGQNEHRWLLPWPTWESDNTAQSLSVGENVAKQQKCLASIVW
jgi:hypothetical protein